MMTPLSGGYKERKRGRNYGLENWGKRDTRVLRKDKSWELGNLVQISRKRLGYIVIILAEPRSRDFRAKSTL